jgi:translation elongation factor EF-G
LQVEQRERERAEAAAAAAASNNDSPAASDAASAAKPASATTLPPFRVPYLVNLIDSPGHVDFSMDVATAAR